MLGGYNAAIDHKNDDASPNVRNDASSENHIDRKFNFTGTYNLKGRAKLIASSGYL